MKTRLAAAALAAFSLAAVPVVLPPSILAVPALADDAKPAGTPYWFGANVARTTVTFESETSVEVIHGVTHRMNGSVAFDFDKGEGSGELKVPVKSLETGMAARDGHLQGEDWLDAEKFPDIVFKVKSLKRTKAEEAKGGPAKETWAYEGDLTIHGVTKALKGEATVQRVPEDLGKNLGPGSWVKVKAAFQVALKEFAIEVPEVEAAKIAPTWDLKVDIFGTTEEPKAKPAPKAE